MVSAVASQTVWGTFGCDLKANPLFDRVGMQERVGDSSFSLSCKSFDKTKFVQNIFPRLVSDLKQWLHESLDSDKIQSMCQTEWNYCESVRCLGLIACYRCFVALNSVSKV